MAVCFEHEWDDNTDANKIGFAYKFNLSGQWDLARLVEYQSKLITLTGQAEYRLDESIIVNARFKHSKPEEGDAVNDLLIGAEWRPIEIFSLYGDYVIPDEGADQLIFGVSYSF